MSQYNDLKERAIYTQTERYKNRNKMVLQEIKHRTKDESLISTIEQHLREGIFPEVHEGISVHLRGSQGIMTMDEVHQKIIDEGFWLTADVPPQERASQLIISHTKDPDRDYKVRVKETLIKRATEYDRDVIGEVYHADISPEVMQSINRELISIRYRNVDRQIGYHMNESQNLMTREEVYHKLEMEGFWLEERQTPSDRAEQLIKIHSEKYYHKDLVEERYVTSARRWMESIETIKEQQQNLQQLGKDVLSKCGEHLTAEMRLNPYRPPGELDRILREIGIDQVYVNKMAGGGLGVGTEPPTINQILLLIEVSNVGIDIADKSKYKVNVGTHEFERLENEEGTNQTNLPWD